MPKYFGQSEHELTDTKQVLTRTGH